VSARETGEPVCGQRGVSEPWRSCEIRPASTVMVRSPARRARCGRTCAQPTTSGCARSWRAARRTPGTGRVQPVRGVDFPRGAWPRGGRGVRRHLAAPVVCGQNREGDIWVKLGAQSVADSVAGTRRSSTAGGTSAQQSRGPTQYSHCSVTWPGRRDRRPQRPALQRGAARPGIPSRSDTTSGPVATCGQRPDLRCRRGRRAGGVAARALLCRLGNGDPIGCNQDGGTFCPSS
jgi:hypothetical protein